MSVNHDQIFLIQINNYHQPILHSNRAFSKNCEGSMRNLDDWLMALCLELILLLSLICLGWVAVSWFMA